VKAENNAGSDERSFLISISPASQAPSLPEIQSAALPDGKVGSAYQASISASGDAPIIFTASGSLPAGLSLDSSTGAISGTPTSAGAFSFSVKAENNAGSDERSFLISISPADQGAPTWNAPYFPVSTPAAPAAKVLREPPISSEKAYVRVDTSRTAGYIVGYPDGTFRPERNITRYEVAAILYRIISAESLETKKATPKAFSDTRSGDWYSEAVERLAQIGVINGYPDGTFRGDRNITFAEMSALLYNFTNPSLKSSSKFSKDHWAFNYLLNADSYGFLPEDLPADQLITCMDLVKAVNRLLGWHIQGAANEQEFALAIEGLKK
jgi:hypothetical protein